MLSLNTKSKPLDDKRVRLAFAHALNRVELAQAKGEIVAVPAVSVIPSGYLGTDEQAPLASFDVVKTKQLLTEAGYPNGVTIKAIHTQLPGMLSTSRSRRPSSRRPGSTSRSTSSTTPRSTRRSARTSARSCTTPRRASRSPTST